MDQAAALLSTALGGDRRLTASAPLLARRNAATLSSFALSNVLLAFDYDGTLAPIASTPAQARMRARTRALLRQVARCYPSIVISGRALDDISRRLRGIPLWFIFGNHGSEPALAPAPPQRTSEWVRLLRPHLPPDPGIVLEDKRHSLTVHYRAARDRAAVRRAIVAAARLLPEVRVVGGKEAVNLLRRDAPDKGSALRYALQAFACTTAIYVGDDDTDEDAFRAADRAHLLPVRVGRPTGQSHARFHLESQDEMDQLLERLLQLRQPRFGAEASRSR